jgi:hypothetical protein
MPRFETSLLRLCTCGVLLCLTACGLDYKKRFDKPLTYEQAMKEKDIDFPLPKTAHNINSAMYVDWQVFQHFVRFEAPKEDCMANIDAVLAWHDKEHKTTTSYPRVPVTHVNPIGGDETMGPTPWFDVDKITNGIFAGKNDSRTPEIWVDLDRGVFYYFEAD